MVYKYFNDRLRRLAWAYIQYKQVGGEMLMVEFVRENYRKYCCGCLKGFEDYKPSFRRRIVNQVWREVRNNLTV